MIMFVDSYDVIFTGSATEILSRFSEFAAGAVFSAEGFCWPDASLSKQYPEAEGKKYLNSGLRNTIYPSKVKKSINTHVNIF